jgi:hypothetical protein
VDIYNEDLPSLMGKTLTVVKQSGDESIYFESTEGEKWRMYHDQNCCESVYIEDVAGDLQDLVGSPILMAECGHSAAAPLDSEHPPESCTWTFYKFATVKGYVTVRWYGTSNGYYSETACFSKL